MTVEISAAPVAPAAPISPLNPIASALRTHRWLVLVGVALIGVGGWYAFEALAGPTVVVDKVARGLIVETVVASGNVETPYRANIASQIVGTVKSVQVAEGQTVTAGQPLIALDDTELRADVAQAKDAVIQAHERIDTLAKLTLPSAKESQTQAQATLLDEQKTFDRTSDLTKKGYATLSALDDAQKTLDVDRSLAKAFDLAVAAAAPGGSDYQTAQTQLKQANASLETAAARLGYAEITAPRAGVLITRNVENGYVVQPGTALLVLAPAGQTQLLLEIDERNLGKIALGQTAVTSADAYADQKFPAVVSYINPGVDLTRGSVEVKLDVDNPPSYLRQDMTVSVDIEVGRSDKALALPARAVHDATSTAPWVMGIRDGRAVKIPVALGLLGIAASEIKSGLAEGDVAIPVASTVVLGQRVRAAAP